MDANKILEVFNYKKLYFLHLTRQRANKKLFSYVDVEQIVDDILERTIKAYSKGAVVFIDEKHIEKYFYACIKNNLRRIYRMKVVDIMNRGLPDHIRKANFELARDIINTAREEGRKSLEVHKEIEAAQKQRKQPYQFHSGL